MKIWKRKIKKEVPVETEQNSNPQKTKVETARCLLMICTFIEIEKRDSLADEQKGVNEYRSCVENRNNTVLLNWKRNERTIYKDGEERRYVLNPNTAIEDDLKEALLYLTSDEAKNNGFNLENGYDFAWIKLAIDQGLVNGYDRINNYSYPKFRELVCSFGFENLIAKEKTLLKYYNYANANTIPWIYSDCNAIERNRRNEIVLKFVEYMGLQRGWNDNMNHFMNRS